ncbi:MAG: HD domain-containing protein [Nitrospinae bacterium]|nr:HD domain-containing protein [Nitrospinota bacterium]
MRSNENIVKAVEPAAREYFADARGSHGWDHVLRVLHLCEHIGREDGLDMTVLRLAALLHDVGRSQSDRQGGATCHAALGADIAREVLLKAGAGEVLIENVVHCVAAHRFRGGVAPESPEAKALFDADKLDGIGAVGIGRAFQFAGEVGARLHDPDVDIDKTQSYSQDDTAYREYLVKLRHVKERMLTAAGKRIAGERHAFMEEFFGRLNAEVMGDM